MTASNPPRKNDPEQSQSPSKKTSRRTFLTTTAVASAAVTLGGTALAAEDSSETESSPSVTFESQTTDGTTVTVKSATLPEHGFIVIHDERLYDDKPVESIIGVTDHLFEGTHENVEVQLFDYISGREFDKSELKEDQTLVAMLHRDRDDNSVFDYAESNGIEDPPVTKDGEAVSDDAEVEVGDDC
ncbi:hypothetical protein SAMN05421858_1632 [Haladaptatus litoreus]|uniref:DUF7282 domain-containing protein n=1 Tax=Haladaptatus litoreus TaxID=553468 RepID=A0A1N6YM58_9EURY|nr:twin-arginine translocation signal domain-containing protein [Haladaptatus litoreus]SIR15647.1 hypothetical protein SAMN05421858_1632 [Haladaptatus litoreus]